MRRLRLWAGMVAISASATGQVGAAAQAATFEVASVKTAAQPEPGQGMICMVPCSPGEKMSVEGARVDIRYMALDKLILAAYRLRNYQLSGPDWMRDQRFDIVAKIPDGASKDRIPEMLQTLLAERFKLTIHREAKDQRVMALVVGSSGSKLRPAAANADAPMPEAPGDKPLYSPQGDARILANGDAIIVAGPLGPMRSHFSPDGLRFDFSKITMAGLAELLTPHVDHPVVDMTNLAGAYSVSWQATPPGGPGGDGGGRKGGSPEAGDAPAARRDIMGDAMLASLEKAGLKLEARRAPVDTIVVDHLEKTPTGN